MKKLTMRGVGAMGVAAAIALTGCSADTGTAEPGTPGEPAAEATTAFSQELHDALPQEVRDAGRLRIAGEPNAPWRWVDENGDIVGVQTDMLQEFESVLGVDMEVEMLAGLPAAKLGVQGGRYDFIFGPLVDNKTTQKELSFVDYTFGAVSFVHMAETEAPGAVTDLCGKTISVLDGSAAIENNMVVIDEICQEAGSPVPNLLRLSDQNGLILALDSGRADFASVNVSVGAYTVQQRDGAYAVYIPEEERLPRSAMGMGIDPAKTELQDALLGALEATYESGAFEEIMTKYGLQDVSMEEPGINKGTV